MDTVLEYSGSDTLVERINATGPIKADIYLQLLSVGQLYPPNIHYKYMISTTTLNNRNYPPQQKAIATNSYYWRYSENWSECSVNCQGKKILYMFLYK